MLNKFWDLMFMYINRFYLVYQKKKKWLSFLNENLKYMIKNYSLWFFHLGIFLFANIYFLALSQFSSVAQLCPTLCNPMDGSMPGFPVLHHLLEFAQTLVQWCHPTVSSSVVAFSSCSQSFPAPGSFPKSQFFASGGQNTGASVISPSSEYSVDSL